MSINYAERFERQIEQQFARELTSANIATNNRYRFIDAQTIRVPTIQLSGYKDHARDGSKNRLYLKLMHLGILNYIRSL